MGRKAVDVAVIIPDASPVLTLVRIGRIDLLGSFTAPIKIVDQVFYEITKTQNDPNSEVAAALQQLHNQIDIVETNVGVGYQTRRARNPQEPSTNLGEIAVDEYATSLAGPASCRSCCLKTLILWNYVLPVSSSPSQHDALAYDPSSGGAASRGAGTGRKDQRGTQDSVASF
jgi:hypothetical protein